MPRQSTLAWEALRIGWETQLDGVPPEVRLEALQDALDKGTARRLGTNILSNKTDLGVNTRTLAAMADYSIFDRPSDVQPTVHIRYSHIGNEARISGVSAVTRSEIEGSIVSNSEVTNSVVINDSEVKDSTVKDSKIVSSILTIAEVRKSEVIHSHLMDSLVERSKLNNVDLINEAEIEDSEVDGSELESAIDGLQLAEAALVNGKHLIDVGVCIGIGNRVLAYRLKTGGYAIQAGCKEFSSVAEMLKYAPTAREYDHIDPKTRGLYLAQIRAFGSLVRATVRQW